MRGLLGMHFRYHMVKKRNPPWTNYIKISKHPSEDLPQEKRLFPNYIEDKIFINKKDVNRWQHNISKVFKRYQTFIPAKLAFNRRAHQAFQNQKDQDSLSFTNP